MWTMKMRLAVKFQEAMLRLPEKRRLIFNLRYYDELDYEEIPHSRR